MWKDGGWRVSFVGSKSSKEEIVWSLRARCEVELHAILIGESSEWGSVRSPDIVATTTAAITLHVEQMEELK